MSHSVSSQSLLEGEHEEVHFFHDPTCGLKAIVAIHDTSLGPALGGVRCRSYASADRALADALHLSRAMTYKCAIAGIPAGGGKAVVLETPDLRRPEAFQSLGARIDGMGGRFFTARDLGTSDEDLHNVRRSTRHAVDPEGSSAQDLGQRTADGVFRAAESCLEVLGRAEWKRVVFAVQGLGDIGLKLALRAAQAGATVIGCDSDADRVGRALDTAPIEIVDPDAIYDVPCLLFSPCAVGGLLDDATVERLKCSAVVGAANNQLATPRCGDRLSERGILYAPDYVVNAGAVIFGCGPALPGFRVPEGLRCIERTIRQILLESLQSGEPTHRIADRLAEERWRTAREQRCSSQTSA